MHPAKEASRLLLLAVLPLAACSDRNPVATAASPATRYTAPAQPVNGEFIRAASSGTVYMVYNQTLYGVPDQQTLRACTGGHPQVVRVVSSLPAWTQKTLPASGNPESLTGRRDWMYGDRPIVSSAGSAAYAVVGCVRAGITSPTVYQSIYGDQDWNRELAVPDAEFQALPEGPLAAPVPLRRAGTLFQTSSGTVEWSTYQGGSLGVPDPQTLDSYCRGWSEINTNATEAAAYGIQGAIQPGPGVSPSCLRGDDYPDKTWTFNAGDQWNFAARNCTSFVAWRLNQDGIAFHNYYGGPHWGDASNWAVAAASVPANSSRPRVWVDHTPSVGAVAQWNSNHVAYVAGILTSGDIVIEEYNVPAGSGVYNKRTISPSSVNNFIHLHT
jgi:surface antigen